MLNSVKSYKELLLPLNCDKYLLSVEICERILDDNFLLYENQGEISIGIGNYTSVIVTDKKIIVDIEGEIQNIKIGDLSTSLSEIFSAIKLQGWRAYGIANFDLARFNYGLPIESENNILLKMFIPKIEYRINDKEIIIRSLYIKDLESEKMLIQKLMNSIGIEKSFNSSQCRIEKEKLNPANTFIQDANYYKDMVSQGVKEIKQSMYQKIIVSRRILLEKRLDMWASYLAGRMVNTPARSYMLKIDDLQAIGFSPETVAEVDETGIVYTFPLAGTRALLEDIKRNEQLKEELLHDSKEIAEHAISVKLAYEELSEICDEESVVVSEFMSVMERGTVQHIGSRIRGKLKDGYNSWHAFNKLFPAVTATGIPKKESIEAIGRLEKDSRNLYSGSVLIYDSTKALDAALVLRTVFQNNNETWLRAGAGIVDMSKPERELEETCEKLKSVAKQLVLES